MVVVPSSTELSEEDGDDRERTVASTSHVEIQP